MLETYPKAEKYAKFDNESVDILYKMIQDIRNYKVTNKMAPNAKIKLSIDTSRKLFDGFNEYLGRFSFAKEINISKDIKSDGVKFVYHDLIMYVEDDVSLEEKNAKKQKDIERLQAEIKRCEGLLNNPNFVSKAPKEKIELEKSKLENYRKQLDLLT